MKIVYIYYNFRKIIIDKDSPFPCIEKIMPSEEYFYWRHMTHDKDFPKTHVDFGIFLK